MKSLLGQYFTIGTIGAIVVFLLGLFVGTKVLRPVTSGPSVPEVTVGPSDTPYDLDTGEPSEETTFVSIPGDSILYLAPPESLYAWWPGGIIQQIQKKRNKLRVSVLQPEGFFFKDFNLVGNDFSFWYDNDHNDWMIKSQTTAPDPPKRFKIRGMIVGTSLPSASGCIDFVYKNIWLIGAGAVWSGDYNNKYFDKYLRAGVQFEMNF